MKRSRKTAYRLFLSASVLSISIAPSRADQIVNGGATVNVPADHASPWNIGGDLYVGQTTAGTLNISSGATVSAATGYVGFGLGSNGIVTISGANSQWNNSTNLTIGASGTGSLTVSSGGALTNQYSAIGDAATSVSTATVTGTF